jgi:hypothetical protein
MRKGKLYYVPGLISLLGLPILLYFLGPRAPKLLTTMRINLPTEDIKPDPPGLIRFSKWRTYQMLKHQKIVTVDLGENNWSEYPLHNFIHLKKLDFISGEIARRQFTHDTGSVLKIQLGDDCTYGDFAWVLNQAKVYDVKRFVFIDDAYYLFTNPPRERVPDLVLSPLDVVYSQPVEVAKPPAWEIFKKWLMEWVGMAYDVIKGSYIYVSGFLLLIVIPGILRLRNKGMRVRIK